MCLEQIINFTEEINHYHKNQFFPKAWFVLENNHLYTNVVFKEKHIVFEQAIIFIRTNLIIFNEALFHFKQKQCVFSK